MMARKPSSLHKATLVAADTQPPKRFTPLFNDVFLKIFGSADSEPVTKPLLNAVLRIAGIPEIEHVERITADASLPGGIECKTARLDVVVFSDDGRLFDLEAQRQKVDIGSRSIFYASKLIVENTPKGPRHNYSDIPQVVVVVLLEGNTMFPDNDQFVTSARMRWDAPSLADSGPDNITLVVVELDKVRARYNIGNLKDVLADESLAWLYLLANGYKNPEEMGKMSESFPTMEEFAERYGIAIGDPELKRAYDAWWMSEMEYNSIVDYAQKEGLAKGVEQGVRQGIEQGIEQSIAALRAAGLHDAADLLEQKRNQ